jgi:hypothetical protein
VAVHGKYSGVLLGGEHSPGDLAAVAPRDRDQPVHGAAPVPGMSERSVDSGRGDLEGVRQATRTPGGSTSHDGGIVEGSGDGAADLCHLVEIDPTVPVDDDPKHLTAPDRSDVEFLEVEPTGRDHGLQQGGDLVALVVTEGGRAHRDLLAGARPVGPGQLSCCA